MTITWKCNLNHVLDFNHIFSTLRLAPTEPLDEMYVAAHRNSIDLVDADNLITWKTGDKST